jgi:hypothetical protein
VFSVLLVEEAECTDCVDGAQRSRRLGVPARLQIRAPSRGDKTHFEEHPRIRPLARRQEAAVRLARPCAAGQAVCVDDRRRRCDTVQRAAGGPLGSEREQGTGDERGEAIRHGAADGRPVLEWFETRIVDDEGGLVARVRKQVYVRRRPG